MLTLLQAEDQARKFGRVLVRLLRNRELLSQPSLGVAEGVFLHPCGHAPMRLYLWDGQPCVYRVHRNRIHRKAQTW